MLLFMDSGDHYAATISSGKWSTGGGDSDPTSGSLAGLGRFGTNPIVWGWTQGRWVGKSLDANYQELIVGAAVWYHGDQNFGGSNTQSIRFVDSGTVQLALRYTITGAAFHIYRGDTTSSLLATIPHTFLTSGYEYIELRAKIHNTLGEYELRVNGVTIGSATGLDTQASGNAYANAFYLSHSDQADHYYDDCYCLEMDSSTGASDFLGDVRVESLFPSGNGNSSQFIGSDSNSTDNYLLVDEHAPNGDTDYVESGSVGNKDTYAYTDVSSASGTVFGVQPMLSAKKTDAGARSIASIARLSTTEEDSADFNLTTTYSYTRDIREEKPGGGAWTITDVNAAEFGVKVTV